ncbi:MAG: CHASE2 domain-containing protein [Luteimonas sp.]
MPRPRPRALQDRLYIGAAGIVLLTLLTWFDATWRADVVAYDLLQSSTTPEVDPDIVLVLVDDRSLDALGRWPWSRAVHAQLLDRLRDVTPRGIAFDVMFAEPDGDPAADAALAAAIKARDRVALPVMVDVQQSGGLPIEVMPLPALSAAAAALGHAEVELDRDGVARRTSLYAGLGSPHWPALALALRDLDPRHRSSPLPGERAHADTPDLASPYHWHRDRRVLVPFAPADAFAAVSFVDVLDGTVPASRLQDRWILIGVDAAGLGQRIFTPVTAPGGGQSATRYHANVLNALLTDATIAPLTRVQQVLLGALLLLVPLALLHAPARSGGAWWRTALAILLTCVTSVLLLRIGHLWFAPGATILTLLAAGGTWMLLRLRRSQRLAISDAVTGLGNRALFDTALKRETAAARRSGKPLSLLLVDVDHFKHFNDTQGHQAGDAALRGVSTALAQRARRPRDLAARYGGDELALILPETPSTSAARIADALGADIRRLAIPHPGAETAPVVTLSIGVATFDPAHDPVTLDLVARADAALYRAKHAGRDRSALPPDASA